MKYILSVVLVVQCELNTDCISSTVCFTLHIDCRINMGQTLSILFCFSNFTFILTHSFPATSIRPLPPEFPVLANGPSVHLLHNTKFTVNSDLCHIPQPGVRAAWALSAARALHCAIYSSSSPRQVCWTTTAAWQFSCHWCLFSKTSSSSHTTDLITPSSCLNPLLAHPQYSTTNYRRSFLTQSQATHLPPPADFNLYCLIVS